MKTKNKYAFILWIIGLLTIILGICGSVVLGDKFSVVSGTYYYHKEYNVEVAIMGIIASIVSGAITMGIAEAIRLLDLLNLKMKGLSVKLSAIGQNPLPIKKLSTPQFPVNENMTVPERLGEDETEEDEG